jgi:hypothetical protein
MKLKFSSLILFGFAPWLISGGLSLHAGGICPRSGPEALATDPANAHSFAALMQDIGPEGIFVDTQGFDNNNDVAGNVMYNNQTEMNIHVHAVYVHGKNIKTQGKFILDVDIEAGKKVKLLTILRDKLGEPSTIFVEIFDN